MGNQPAAETREPRPDDEFLIEDLDTFEIMSYPMRTTILQWLIFEPMSVKQLAEELDVSVTRLHYHVNILEGAGVIRVVATRKAGAMIQKLYHATADSYRPSRSLVDNIEDPREAARVAAAAVLGTARVDAEQALAARFSNPKSSHPPSSLGRTITRLTTERANEFIERLTTLLEEYADMSGDGMMMSFSFAFCPTAGLSTRDRGDA